MLFCNQTAKLGNKKAGKRGKHSMLDINEQIKGKVLLITGGTGSFGSTVLRHFF